MTNLEQLNLSYNKELTSLILPTNLQSNNLVIDASDTGLDNLD
jgi:hypothetical protein